MTEVAQAFDRTLRSQWSPPPSLSLSDWTAEHARLSPESSADVGRFRPYPYQIGILDAIGDPRIERVIVMKSARVGYTKMANFAVAWYVAKDPCPIMVVQPTISDAEGYSKEEIEPMIRDMPILSGLISPASKRDGGNTILKKKFPGGILHMVGADSPRGFRRTSIRVLLMDEIDGWALSAGDEGDQIRLATKRTETFANRKIVAGSTPTLESTSRIKRLFEQGDQRFYFVPCPSCDKPQVLKWQQFHWTAGDPSTVHYECEHCGSHIGHQQKRWMVEEAARRQRAGSKEFGWVAQNPEAKGHASFHLWTAYSYAANATWEHLAAEWEACEHNAEERKTFINTSLGETYKGEGDKPNWKKLYDRREALKTDVVPAGGVILTAGVDVQHNRLEVEIVAWGPRMESWSVGYRVFGGDTSQLEGADSPWQRLGDMLAEEWEHELGGRLSIRIMAVDTGDQTSTVYQWCARWSGQRVMAVKGRAESYDQIVGTPTQTGTTQAGKKSKTVSINLWPVGVSKVKEELYGWLKQEKPTAESGTELPWGWCHFPEYAEEYFRQLTAEELVPVTHRGFRKYIWEVTRKNGRNESLDCFDDKTEILTNSGWKLFRDLDRSEMVATVNLDDESIEYQQPTCYIDKPYDGELLVIEGRTVSIAVTPGHRMVACKKRQERRLDGSRKWNLNTPMEIVLAKDLTIHHQLLRSATWKAEDVDTVEIPAYVTQQGMVRWPAVKVDAGDLAEFLGWIVSEGCTFRGEAKTQPGSVRRRVQIDQNPGAKCDRLRDLLGRLPWSFREERARSCVRFLSTSAQAYQVAQWCGVGVRNKKVPEWVRWQSSRIIARFLEAAILGDGWMQETSPGRNFRSYTTVSRALADGIQELMLKSGKASNIKVRPARTWTIAGRSGSSLPQYHITEINLRKSSLDGGSGGRREFLGKRVQYVGRVFCVTVPNGTLICRRNGKSFIAGNCRVYARAAAYVLLMDKWTPEMWERAARDSGIGVQQTANKADGVQLVVQPKRQRRDDDPWL